MNDMFQKALIQLFNGIISIKFLYYFLMYLILRFYFIFQYERLKTNKGLSALGLILIIATWERILGFLVSIAWIFHIPAIVLSGHYITKALNRLNMDKNDQEKSALKRRVLFLFLESMIVLIILIFITTRFNESSFF